MRHAFLITAYRDFAALESSIEHLLKIEDCFIFITVDKKQRGFISEIKANSKFLNHSKIQWRFDLTINWGSYGHVQAYLDMCKQALEIHADYYHSMTGQCRVVLNPSEFTSAFSKKSENYIEFFQLPRKEWDGKLGGLGRIKFWQLYDFLDAKKHGKFFKRINQYLVSIQKILNISRLQINKTYYGGSGYWSLHVNAVEILLQETRLTHSEWRHTFCPEECIYQTILVNSPLKKTLVNNNLRFVLWDKQHNEIPGILDESNLQEIKKSNAIFARKFDSKISSNLLDLIRSKN